MEEGREKLYTMHIIVGGTCFTSNELNTEGCYNQTSKEMFFPTLTRRQEDNKGNDTTQPCFEQL